MILAEKIDRDVGRDRVCEKKSTEGNFRIQMTQQPDRAAVQIPTFFSCLLPSLDSRADTSSSNFIQPCIFSARRKERFVRALLGDAASRSSFDPVAEAGRGQPVRDERGCLPLPPCAGTAHRPHSPQWGQSAAQSARRARAPVRPYTGRGPSCGLLRLAAGQLNAVRIHLFIRCVSMPCGRASSFLPAPAARRHRSARSRSTSGPKAQAAVSASESRPCGPP